MSNVSGIEEILLFHNPTGFVDGEPIDHAQRAGGLPNVAEKLNGDRGQVVADIGVDDINPGDQAWKRRPPLGPKIGLAVQGRGRTARTKRSSQRDRIRIRNRLKVALAQAIKNVGSSDLMQLVCACVHKFIALAPRD